MKCVIKVIFFIISIPVFSQTNIYESNGKVGVGIPAPAESLDVNGNIKWNGFNSGNPRALQLGYSGGNYGGLGYNINFTSATGLFDRPIADQSSYLEFWHGGFRFFGTSEASSVNGIHLGGGASNLNHFATINNIGNFGIGTMTPAYKLDVAGDMQLVKSDQDPRIYFNRQDWGRTTIGQNGPNIEMINDIYHSGAGINFITKNSDGGSTNKLSIRNNGNIGIGTTTPQKPLEVITADNDYISVGRQISPGVFSGIHFGYLEPGNSSYRKSALVFERLDDAARGKIHILNNGGANSSSASLADSKLTINYDGNIGIGTTQPDAKLTVKGKIHAEEVKVDLNVPGPDYVFEKDYNLKSLEQVEKYVSENKHLPEIPSAKEMKADGISMGDMQMKLLQKIEELTLYSIEQNKKLKTQNARIERLEEALTKLLNK